MEYTTLGDTGMQVSRLCLGGMSFGSKEWRKWVLEEEESKAIIDRALELGITFFDTANMYSQGESERILGSALEGHREEVTVASKVFYRTDPDNPHTGGLSRRAIEGELDASLDRLGMDTLDLYQIHRWDEKTPIETTLRALDDAVRCGKARHIGASSMWAHQFADALHTSERLGLSEFLTMQNHYNLAYREEEREMLPLCAKEDVAVMPWSPLARGYLTRPHEEFETTVRTSSDPFATEFDYAAGGGREINERVAELAAEKGVTMAQLSLAWLLHKEWVDAPIVGTTSVEHLEEAVEAVDIDLRGSDIEYLEEPYEPRPVEGHQ
jgi:aryl-alcohol dehydrogenase-like predicted oxidoreductase